MKTLLDGKFRGLSASSPPYASAGVSSSSPSPLAKAPVSKEQRLLVELLRYRAAQRVQSYLEDVCEEHLRTRSDDASGGGLFTTTVFEGCQCGATVGSLVAPVRSSIHPGIDVKRRALVRRRRSGATHGGSQTLNGVGRALVYAEHGNSGPCADEEAWRLASVEFGEEGVMAVVIPAGCGSRSPLDSESKSALESGAQPVRMVLSELELVEPAPVYPDELLPALEIVEPHGTSKSLVDLLLGKLCAAPDKLKTTFNTKKKTAWRLADEATVRYYEERHRLCELKERLTRQCAGQGGGRAGPGVCVQLVGLDVPLSDALVNNWEADAGQATLVITVEEEDGEAGDSGGWFVPCLTEKCAEEEKFVQPPYGIHEESHTRCRAEVCISAVHLSKLLHRVRHTTTTTEFLFAVATLLLRYMGLCGGGEMKKEAGWHAAIPPDVFAAFISASEPKSPGARSSRRGGRKSKPARANYVTVNIECFASPFNVTLPHFFSVFQDTDSFFGSLGNFFTCVDVHMLRKRLVQCASIADEEERARLATLPLMLRLEANPPFSHEAVSATFKQALGWLENAAGGERARAMLPGFSSQPPIHVSFMMTLPFSSQDRAQAARAAAEESVFCRFSESIHPKRCKYVHGAQQLSARMVPSTTAPCTGASPGANSAATRATSSAAEKATGALVTLSCPTLLMVLQDDTCEEVLPGKRAGVKLVTAWARASSGPQYLTTTTQEK